MIKNKEDFNYARQRLLKLATSEELLQLHTLLRKDVDEETHEAKYQNQAFKGLNTQSRINVTIYAMEYKNYVLQIY